jgi:hypothetical protein
MIPYEDIRRKNDPNTTSHDDRLPSGYASSDAVSNSSLLGRDVPGVGDNIRNEMIEGAWASSSVGQREIGRDEIVARSAIIAQFRED